MDVIDVERKVGNKLLLAIFNSALHNITRYAFRSVPIKSKTLPNSNENLEFLVAERKCQSCPTVTSGVVATLKMPRRDM